MRYDNSLILPEHNFLPRHHPGAERILLIKFALRFIVDKTLIELYLNDVLTGICSYKNHFKRGC
jgi:hypothetical protein